MRVTPIRNAFLSLAGLVSGLVLLELATRVFITWHAPDATVGFPPVPLNIGRTTEGYVSFHSDYNRPSGLSVNGIPVTKGDLFGILQDHAEVGYAPREHTRSLNGWWQSNNVAARSRTDTEKAVPAGLKRVLLFGDSYTNCSRVPQEETWPFYLHLKSRGVEFLNFGVDGYGMGQCLLWFRLVKQNVDYHMAVFVFVPSQDLWRDINTLRQLVGWENYPLVPRFLVAHDRLMLIRSPYASPEEFFHDNQAGASRTLRRHLRRYDRFYCPLMHEAPPPVVGGSFLYRLAAKNLGAFQKQHVLNTIMNGDSEAVRVTRNIFKSMQAETKEDGGRFILVFLPTRMDIDSYTTTPSFRRQYDDLVTSVEHDGISCINLMADCVQAAPDRFDHGYDHSHYGPKANQLIADLIWRHLKENAFLEEEVPQP